MSAMANNQPEDRSLPTATVLQAFDINGEPKRLEGGEGKSYLVGKYVLKPVSNEAESIWRAEILSNISKNGFRLATPVRSRYGSWTHDGWEATIFAEGSEVKGRVKEKIAVARKFTAALKNCEKPSFLEKANHPWAIADRMIWGEQKLEYGERLRGVVAQLLEMMQPIELQSQLIHGDMTGNILFHEYLDPLVIDFSPYWRPAEYAVAIIIVDSIVWNGGSESLLAEMGDVSDLNQLLVRATLWRIKTTEEYIKQFGTGSIDDIDSYQPLVELLRRRNL